MIWIMLFELLVVFALFYWLPVMRRTSFFTVQVSREFYASHGNALLRQYRAILCAGFLLHCLSIFWLAGKSPQQFLLFIPILSQLLLFSLLHYVYYLRVKPHKIEVTSARTAASLHARNLWDYTNIAVEAGVLFLLLFPMIVLVYFYPRLPAMIPAHWNFAGQPDRWVTRSWGKIALFPILALWLHGLLVMAKYSILQVKLTLPAQNTAAYFALKEKSLRWSLHYMDAMRLLVGTIIAMIPLNLIISSLPTYKFLEPVSAITLWSCSGAMFIITIFFLYRIMRLNTQLEDLTGANAGFAETNDEGWLGGGTIYYNPNDTALFVEKKLGIGTTINFAHKQAKYFLLYLLGGGGMLFILALTNF